MRDKKRCGFGLRVFALQDSKKRPRVDCAFTWQNIFRNKHTRRSGRWIGPKKKKTPSPTGGATRRRPPTSKGRHQKKKRLLAKNQTNKQKNSRLHIYRNSRWRVFTFLTVVIFPQNLCVTASESHKKERKKKKKEKGSGGRGPPARGPPAFHPALFLDTHALFGLNKNTQNVLVFRNIVVHTRYILGGGVN